VQFCDGSALRFEDLLTSPVDVMNTLNITFSGLRQMRAEFGDPEALKSVSVRSEKKNKNVLTHSDIKAIEGSGLMDLYNSIERISCQPQRQDPIDD